VFTGIVQTVGVVRETGLVVAAEGLPYEPPEGGSVAIDGCCLTRVLLPPPALPSSRQGETREGSSLLRFDLSEETLARTTLGSLREGSRVNVELALRAGDAIGGHFVTGHVDGVGEFMGSSGEEFRFRAPEGGERFLADKGSITLAGVSLTVVRPLGLEFSVALVPHTLSVTTLGALSPGDRVNVEYDVLARYSLGGA